MRAWPRVRVAFMLGALLMSLLIIAYWDNISRCDGGVLPPLYGSLCFDLINRTVGDPPPPQQPVRETPDPDAKPHATHLSVRQRKRTEEKDRDLKRGRRKGETLGEEARESGSVSAEVQKARKQRVADACSEMTSSEEFPAMKRNFSGIPVAELDHFIVDDKHRVIYCYVPKVACTNWKKVMMILSESLTSPSGKPYTDPKKMPTEIVHKESNYLSFDKFPYIYGSLSRHLMAVKLQTYTKFLFVRDPFVRLISAFRNKFEKPNQSFYRSFGAVMLHRYGNVSRLPDTVQEAFAAGLRPTFQQFITYLLDPRTERGRIFNEHWRQIYRLCHPCQVKYDFIGQLETLDTDAQQLLRLMKVDDLFRFPSAYGNHTVATWVSDWFKQIPMEARRKLYKLYEPDFKLFGYPKPDVLEE